MKSFRTTPVKYTVFQEGHEVVQNHSCKRAHREERALMKYLQKVLEILVRHLFHLLNIMDITVFLPCLGGDPMNSKKFSNG